MKWFVEVDVESEVGCQVIEIVLALTELIMSDRGFEVWSG